MQCDDYKCSREDKWIYISTLATKLMETFNITTRIDVMLCEGHARNGFCVEGVDSNQWVFWKSLVHFSINDCAYYTSAGSVVLRWEQDAM